MNKNTNITQEGYRLLALAYKNIDSIPKDLKHLKKEKIYKKNLVFVGLFKRRHQKNIYNLQNAKYKLMIITEDNVLTAIKVGLSLNMGISPYILEE